MWSLYRGAGLNAVLSDRLYLACSALVGSGRLTLGFALGVKGAGGVFSIFRRTSSRVGSLGTKFTPEGEIEDDLMAFGRIVLLWGQIEAILAGFTLAVNHPKLGLKHKDVPHTFALKRRRVIEAACGLSGLAPIREELKAEIEILNGLHEKRSWITIAPASAKTGSVNSGGQFKRPEPPVQYHASGMGTCGSQRVGLSES